MSLTDFVGECYFYLYGSVKHNHNGHAKAWSL